jgi:hypothetical protein
MSISSGLILGHMMSIFSLDGAMGPLTLRAGCQPERCHQLWPSAILMTMDIRI